MNFLLDTHSFLWFVANDRRLSSNAESLIKDRENQVYFSAVSAWEISIKVGLGRLSVEGDLHAFLLQQLTENGFLPLSINISHSLNIINLPDVHKDPFDRMLISQSKIEEIPLISKDKNIRKYDVDVFW